MEQQALREGSHMEMQREEPLLLEAKLGDGRSSMGSQLSIIDNDTALLDKNIKDLKMVYSDDVFNHMARAFRKLIANPDPPAPVGE